jgi:hypothetical protein
MLQAAHLGQKLVRQDADIGPRQAGGGEHVDDVAVRGDRLRDPLTDGSVDLLGRLAGGCLFSADCTAWK